MNKSIVSKKNLTKYISIIGIMSAVGFVLMLLEFPLPFLIPPFIKLDFSEIPALIVAFALDPLSGVVVCVLKNVMHLPFSTTACVGELSNAILGAVFVGIAGLIYQKSKSRKSALIGTVVGAISMAVISIFTNYFFVYPFFAAVLIPMDIIIELYQMILPAADNLLKALLIFNLPFNIAKGLLDAAICFLVYKRLSPILKINK